MQWINSVAEAIKYIESHITQEITVENVANHVSISPFYLQKGFGFLCGFSIAEYIRKRKLALAGSEIASSNKSVIDIALKYGYSSPDSFCKAFTRFHGVTPTIVRKGGVTIKSFSPLKIKFLLEGGNIMDYKIVKKKSFTVIGVSKTFTYDNASTEIPRFWNEHYSSGNGKIVCGMYGINHDESMAGDKFEYFIADDYNESAEVPQGFAKEIIPAYTWAIFPCKGAMPKAMQSINKQIFSQWLPSCNDYEITAGYCIEFYDDPTKYQGGVQSPEYYCEMWIPVKKKA